VQWSSLICQGQVSGWWLLVQSFFRSWENIM
jgi:hypothetical protein